MGIINRDGFLFHDGLSKDVIVVEDDAIERYVNYIREKDIRSISINGLTFKNNNIDFLKDCPHVEKVNIISNFISDYSGLYYLKMLKVLYLDETRGVVDLSKFENLEEFAGDVSKNIVGFEKCSSLRSLHLAKYKPQNRNLEDLYRLNKIEELILTQSSVASLKGCGNFPALKRLELNYISKLEILDELEHNAHSLKELFIYSCKRIRNHHYLGCLEKLEKLSLIKCGEISSIKFIKALHKLKGFVFVRSNILDGDLSPCVGLEYVAFTSKKHYSHKKQDFKSPTLLES